MEKKIKLVIFDLDGTLINAYRAVARSINFTMKELGLPVQDSYTIRRSVGWGDRRLLESFVGKEHLEGALQIYRRHHETALPKGTRFLPGAQKLLLQLKKRKYKLAVASNRPTKFSRIALKALKIAEYFDYVLCADKLKKGKPHPEILQRILKRLRIERDEALYIGDMTIDVQTARRAHIKVVSVLTGSSTAEEIKKLKPDRIIQRISSLLPVLDGANGKPELK